MGHTLCLIIDTGGVEAVAGPTGTVAAGPPIIQTAPTISGDTVEGKTLTANPGTWRGTGATTGGISFTYQWKRCNSSGGVCGKPFTAPSASPTYVLQAADVGHTMQVLVTATNSAGSTQGGAKKATAVVTAASPPSNNPGGSNNNNGGNNGGKNGGNTGGNNGGSHPSGNSAKIRAVLLNALVLHGKNARIRALLKNGGYALSFAAPSRGRLVLSWFGTSKKGKRVLVATVTFAFQKSGAVRIKVVLTGKGRKLLTGARRMTVLATGAFTPAGQATVSARRTLTLKP